MSTPPTVTIINNNHLRGVIAPADVISKKLLEDMVDFFELSSDESAKETETLIDEADKDNLWTPLDAVRTLSDQAE